MTVEEWRPVMTHVGLYEVSSLGRVRTVERTFRTALKNQAVAVLKSRVLVQTVGGRAKNYKRVMLKNPQRHAYVHHLVTEAFYGPRSEGTQVCHINDNGFDNRAVNLYYGTRDDNEIDRYMAGRINTPEYAALEEAPF